MMAAGILLVVAALILGFLREHDVLLHDEWETVEAISGLTGIALCIISLVAFVWKTLP